MGGGGVSKITRYCVTSFMDDPLFNTKLLNNFGNAKKDWWTEKGGKNCWGQKIGEEKKINRFL